LLDIAASHREDDLTATIRITGTADQPQIDLSSIPDLPRDEIVSRILFGKGTERLSTLETAQLGLAIAELSGRTPGGLDILGLARKTLGVDVLRVEEAGDSGPAVSAGKYLSDKIYLELEQGLGAESGNVSIELEVTPNISVTSEVSGTGASSSGVQFQWDY